MRVSIVYNPRSGRGKAQRLAEGIERLAAERGHEIHAFDISRGDLPSAEQLGDTDRIVIVGGDGTVHHLLPMLMQTKTPFQHCGTGTANLICHALGMARDPKGVVRQLEAEHAPSRIDVPRCNGHPFLIMTSLGIDASVIHRLEETRKLGGYRAYVGPVISEVFRPRPARARVLVDGQEQPKMNRAGIYVIANMPDYGGKFNPCADASWDDGKLDIAHIPATTSVGAGMRYLGLLLRINAATRARGSEIMLEAAADSCVQTDGEKPVDVPHTLAEGESLHFTMSEQSVYAHAPRPE